MKKNAVLVVVLLMMAAYLISYPVGEMVSFDLGVANAVGVTSDGMKVAAYYYPWGGVVSWTEAGGVVTVDTDAEATAISDDGRIFGSKIDATLGYELPCYWDSLNTYFALPYLAYGQNSNMHFGNVWSCNSAGTFLGGMQWIAASNTTPVMWYQDDMDVWQILDLMPADSTHSGRINTVSEDGTRFGGWIADDQGSWIPSVWTVDENLNVTYEAAPAPPDWVSGEVSAFSQNGNYMTGHMNSFGALWFDDGTFELYHPENPPGWMSISSTAVSNDGLCVGRFIDFWNWDQYACMYKPGMGFTRADDYFDMFGVVYPADYQFLDAVFWVSADESMMMGWYYDINYALKFYMLVLPELSYIEGNVTLNGTIGTVEEVQISVANTGTLPDSTGFYSVPIGAGTYDVTASMPGYVTEVISGVIVPGGVTVTGQDFILNQISNAGFLEGNLTQIYNYDPYTSVTITADDGTTQYSTNGTDLQTYQLILPAGTYDILATQANCFDITVDDVVVVENVVTLLDFDFVGVNTPAFMHLDFVVDDPSTFDWSIIKVKIGDNDWNTTYSVWASSYDGEIWTPGTYTVSVWAPGHEIWTQDNVEFIMNQTTSLTIPIVKNTYPVRDLVVNNNGTASWDIPIPVETYFQDHENFQTDLFVTANVKYWSTPNYAGPNPTTTEEMAYEGSKSLKIATTDGIPEDIYIELWPEPETGVHVFESMLYIPAGYCGHQGIIKSGGTWDPSFAIENFYRADGTLEILYAGTELTGTYPQDEWFSVKLVGDLDNDIIEYYQNGELIVSSQYSLDAWTGEPGEILLDLYDISAEARPSFTEEGLIYMDNYAAYMFSETSEATYSLNLDTVNQITGFDGLLYQITGLTVDETYTAGVIADYDWASSDELTDEFTYDPETTEPPENLSYVSYGNDVTLNWDTPGTNRDLTGYKVYRDAVEIAELTTGVTEYIDYDLEYATYEYYVTALYTGTTESAPSNTVVVDVVALDLDEPTDLFITNTGLASWSAPTVRENRINIEAQNSVMNSRDLMGYNVYLDGELVTENIADEFHQYFDLVVGETYTGGVAAYYDEGESDIVTFEFLYDPFPVAIPPNGLQIDEQGYATWNSPQAYNTEELIYDNGVASGSYSTTDTYTTFMDPGEICQVLELKYHTSAGTEFNAEVWGWEDGEPTQDLLLQELTTTVATDDWTIVDISAQNLIVDGDFLVGYGGLNWDTYLSVDYQGNGRSWIHYNWNGSWYYDEWTTYLIRAVVQYSNGRIVELSPSISIPNTNNQRGSKPKDDIKIKFEAHNVSETTRDFLGYNIYLDGIMVAENVATESYQFTDLVGGTYTGGVTANYDEGESDEITTIFTYNPPVFDPPANLFVSELGYATWDEAGTDVANFEFDHSKTKDVDFKSFGNEVSKKSATDKVTITKDINNEKLNSKASNSDNSRELLGYNTWLDGISVGFTTDLFYDYDDASLVNGQSYLAEVTALYDNGESDPIGYTFIYDNTPTVLTLPVDEGFEGGVLPDGWTVEYAYGTIDWTVDTGGQNGNPGAAHGGTYNALFYGGSYNSNISWLISPPIDASAVDALDLTFWHTQAVWAGDQDELKVHYRLSDADPWVQLEHYTDDVPAWTERILNIPEASAILQIGLEGIDGYGYGVCIDDINIVEHVVSPLAPPANLFVSELGYATWDVPGVVDNNLVNDVKSRKDDKRNRSKLSSNSLDNSRELIGYNVSLDGVFDVFTTELFHQYTDLTVGQTYIAEVTAVYDEGESDSVEYTFIYEPATFDPPTDLFVDDLGYATWTSPSGGGGDLFELVQHDGIDVNGYFQAWDSGYGVVYDLSGYTNVTIEMLDFHHSSWGITGTWDYSIHIVDWDTYTEITEVTGLLTTVDDDWELEIDLGSVSASGLVGIFMEPMGNTAADAYPCLDSDGEGPDGMSYYGPLSDYAGMALSDIGDFLMDLWIMGTATDGVVKAPKFAANFGNAISRKASKTPEFKEITLQQNTYRSAANDNSRDLTGYNVYLDGVLEDYTIDEFYQYSDLTNGVTYLAGVSAVYDDPGESEIVEFEFTYAGVIPFDPPTNVEVDDVLGIVTWSAPAVGGVIIEDNFDSYTVGDYIGVVGDDWTTWSGTPGGADDALVTDVEASSPSNSVVVELNQDLVLIMDDYTSGVYTYEMKMFVPTGYCGYFNIQNTNVPGTGWAFQIYFQTDGTALADAGAAGALTYAFNHDEWMELKIVIDLDADWAIYYHDGVEMIGYQYSLGTFGSGTLLSFGGVNIFGGANSTQPNDIPMFYFDDVVLSTESTRELTGYNVYLDGDLLDTVGDDVFDYTYEGLVNGDEYVAGVSADYDGEESEIIEVTFIYTGTDVGDVIIVATKLNGNYPNPFNPVTNIAYSIRETGKVTLQVYNIKGQLVKTLVNEVRETGNYTVTWNGRDNSNKSVASGVYFYKMKAQNYNNTKKMILMK